MEYYRSYVYCIICDRTVGLLSWEDYHIVTNPEVHGDICYGPFTFSPPPTEQKDWELFVDVPSPAELVEMDAVASELLTEFSLA